MFSSFVTLIIGSFGQDIFQMPCRTQSPNFVGNFMETVSNFKVTDRQSFIKFIDLLRQDLLNNSKEWENDTLDRFLEAMSAYAEDIQGYYDNMKIELNANEPNWQTFADILKGATIYE